MALHRTFRIEPILAGLACSLLFGYGGLADAESVSGISTNRYTDPVVITGNRLRIFDGVEVDHIIAFCFRDAWEQIPVQIDERKHVDFEAVYGNPTVGHGTMAYTDDSTYVGLDTNPAFDADDELVFMAKDAGQQVLSPADFPPAVLADSRIEVEIGDPLDGNKVYVYLFESNGSLTPDAGQDYVAYNFNLIAGDYKPKFRTDRGPNPEDSEIYSEHYYTHFSDRWIRDELGILSGPASGVDILDRHKTGRGPGDCSRNLETASGAEGAFFTNKDGCVRAIRSYMGYNSGPYVQREHLFYEQRHEINTYWRVHAASGLRDVYDFSPEAEGMVYYNDLNTDGAPIDGTPDDVKLGLINWEMVTGQQGTLITCHSIDTDLPVFETPSYYSDDKTPDLTQCTGDGHEFGVSGIEIWDWPNTDPAIGAKNYLTFRRIDLYEPPDTAVDTAIMYHQNTVDPLDIRITAVTPPKPIFVDADAVNDPVGNDPAISDPLENGSPEHPFDTIQKAIDYAVDGEVVVLLPGTYSGEGNRNLDFKGKAITLRSQNGPSDCIIDCEGAGRGLVFQSGEGPDSMLKGFTITGGEAEQGGGIYCVKASSPTFRNCIFTGNIAYGSLGRSPRAYGGAPYCHFSSPTIVNCTFGGNLAVGQGGGIYCEEGSLAISNCIFWDNMPDGLYGDNIGITYSNIQGGFGGEGNIDLDPLFADPDQGDYHLASLAGRFNPYAQTWVLDDITSPCVDGGDPTIGTDLEPQPNGATINMGAYGGTPEASKSVGDGS